MTSEDILIFIIVSFSFALVVLIKRNDIPDKLRRPLALMAVIMVALAFVLMLCSFFL